MKVCGIYKITNPDGLIYIGQSMDIGKRINVYKNKNCKSQVRLFNSINKHGWGNHTFEILYTIDLYNKLELDALEISSIKKFNCVSPNGLNIDLGGNSVGKTSDETKKKQSIAKKGKYDGEKNPFYGKKHSEETKRLNSQSKIGIPNKRKGKIGLHHHTEETKNKISANVNKTWSNPILREKQRQIGLVGWTDEKRKAWSDITLAIFTEEKRDEFSKMYTGEGNPFYGKKHSDETKKTISEKKRGTPSPLKNKKRPNLAGKNNKKSKQIQQFSLDGILIKNHESLGQASIETGVSRLTIRTSCNGLVKKPRKFIFKYGKS